MIGRGSLLGVLLACAALAGCARGRACAPIASHAAASPSALECAASSGDKSAQLELGIRYEAGAGVPRDLERAESLYERAARARSGSAIIYSPAVGKEQAGRLIPVSPPPVARGLPEARRRLEALRRSKASGRARTGPEARMSADSWTEQGSASSARGAYVD